MLRLWLSCGLLLGVFVSVHPCVGEEKTNHESTAETILKVQLPLLGHRNWIVISDMAYPLQVSPGIETVYVGGDHLDTIREVLDLLDGVPHVRPQIYIDKELKSLAEVDAPGIETIRSELVQILKTKNSIELMHEDIIRKLDEAGKSFKIVILKTDCTLPYTSVFVQLECGYWSEDAEKRLRKTLK